MKVLEKYYDIVDRPASEINAGWKSAQLLTFFLVIASGYIASYSFTILLGMYGSNCILYAEVVFVKNENQSVEMDMNKTSWGSDTLCEFCMFIPLMGSILAIILAAFFVIYPTGGVGFYKTTVIRVWQIIFPSIVLTLCYSIFSIVAAHQVTSGLYRFCENFEPILNSTRCENMDTLNISKYFTREKLVIHHFGFNANMQLTIVNNNLVIVGWILSFVILVSRVICVADFKILEVTIREPDKSAEYQPLTHDNRKEATVADLIQRAIQL